MAISFVGRLLKGIGNFFTKEDYNKLMIRELEQYRRIENIKEPLFLGKSKNRKRK